MYVLYALWALLPTGLSRIARSLPPLGTLLFVASLSATCLLQDEQSNRDREVYTQLIQLVSEEGLPVMEPGFYVLVRLLALFFQGNQLEIAFFLVVSVASLALKMALFRRYGHSISLCIAAFLSYYFMVHEMTQVRTGLAIGLLYFSWYRYAVKDMRGFWLYGILACLFHLSTIVFLLAQPLGFGRPLRQWSRRAAVLLAVGLCVAALGKNVFFLLNDVGSIMGLDRVTIYLAMLDEDILSSISPLRLIPHVLLMAVALSVSRKWKKDRITLLTFQAYATGAILFILFSPVPALAYRVSDLFVFAGVILLGRLSNYFKSTIYYAFAAFYTGASLLYTLNASGIFVNDF